MPTPLPAFVRRLSLPALCFCALTLFVLAAPRSAFAATYYVSPSGSDSNSGTSAAPFLTIQYAINTSVNGDTVMVEDGTYTGPGDVDLDFGGRNITVTSVNGPNSTIINCQGSSNANHRGFHLHDYETNAVISGFTVENGAESYNNGEPNNSNGAGILIENSGATVQNCIIKNNAAGSGGGIYDYNDNYNYDANYVGTITITNCTFTGNSANNGGGVGNYNDNNNGYGGTITLNNCTVTGNTADYGGGISNTNNLGCTITLANCTVTGNMVTVSGGGEGGGVYNANSDGGATTLTNCTITDNVASYGGGVLNENSNHNYSGDIITLLGCVLTDNHASISGGGAYNWNYDGGTITLADCSFAGNSATSAGTGGALYNYNSNGVNAAITVTNCTVTGSTASNGGGVYNSNESGSVITLTNATITGNTASNGGGGGVFNDAGASALINTILYGDTGGEVAGTGLTATYSDIQGGYSGTSNIDADPLFVNSPTDLHLQPGSPCLGAGTPSGAPATTIDGYTRPNPPSIGAYEIAPPALASLTASPISVLGGKYTYLTAALMGKATSTATITLTSSNPAALSVPSSVTIGTGYTSVTFHATSSPVTAVTNVTLTATYNGVSKTTIVTVNPPGLYGLTTTPTSITGGGTATLETILNAKATVNATIALSSSNPTVLPVPASVAINAGYTSKTITLTSTAVTTATVVTITGTYNGVSASVNITIVPVALASVTASPTTVQGGVANSSVTVALTNKAASTVTVSLSSSNPSVLSVPASATIGAGYQSKTVTATSHTVATSTPVTITATYDGVSKTTTVTVTP